MSEQRGDGPGGGGPGQPVKPPARLVELPPRRPRGGAVRVLGGVPALPGQYGYCCCLGYEEGQGGVRWRASGVLVREDVVLTAAHVLRSPINRVFLGGQRVADLDGGVVVGLRGAPVVHESFTPGESTAFGNDLALLFLETPASVRPLPLALAEEVEAATRCTVVGFGANDPEGRLGFGTKRYVELGIQPAPLAPDQLAAHEELFGYSSKVEFVAGRSQLGLDAVHGDSGGPAVITVPAGERLIGITSRGVRGSRGRSGDGSIYEKVIRRTAWLRGHGALPDAGGTRDP